MCRPTPFECLPGSPLSCRTLQRPRTSEIIKRFQSNEKKKKNKTKQKKEKKIERDVARQVPGRRGKGLSLKCDAPVQCATLRTGFETENVVVVKGLAESRGCASGRVRILKRNKNQSGRMGNEMRAVRILLSRSVSLPVSFSWSEAVALRTRGCLIDRRPLLKIPPRIRQKKGTKSSGCAGRRVRGDRVL